MSCGTTSTDLDPFADSPSRHTSDESLTRVFSNINEYVEAYFDRTPVPKFYEANPWYLEHGRPTPVASTYNNPAPYNSTKISFPTPFVHLPRAGASERDATIAVDAVAPCKESLRFNFWRLECSQDQMPGYSDYLPANKPSIASFNDVAEDYGHVPQTLLDWMLKDPLNVAQFPDLAACLPGGPSIKVQYENAISLALGATPYTGMNVQESIKVQDENAVSPTLGGASYTGMNVQEPVAALTISAENVVDVADCFNPGACPIIPVSNNRAGSPAIASAQVTANPLRLGDSGTKISDQTSPIYQNGVASNIPDIVILPTLAVLEPAGGISEPPRENSADDVAIKDTTKQEIPAADPSSPTSPPLNQEWKAPSVDQVSSNSQVPFGGMSGPPVETLVDEQTPALLNDWATAEVQPQPVDTSSGSGTPFSNDKPATPGDRANENWQANLASLIMDAFGSAIGSTILGRASSNAESPASPTQRPLSSVLGTTTSARNETRTNTSDNVESESGTTNGRGVDGAETRDPASGRPPNGTASEGSRAKSLAVRMANRKSRTEVYMFGAGILLAIVIQI
ncbi:MAG: hypothetical protein Q9204_003706 [Flavoplaca sp. TL-2023a]